MRIIAPDFATTNSEYLTEGCPMTQDFYDLSQNEMIRAWTKKNSLPRKKEA